MTTIHRSHSPVHPIIRQKFDKQLCCSHNFYIRTSTTQEASKLYTMPQAGQASECLTTHMTFGVELEFLVISPASAFKDLPKPIGADNKPFAVVHRELLRRGVPSECPDLRCPCCECNECTEADCEPITCIEAWLTDGSKVSSPPLDERKAFDSWTVATDSSMDLTKAETKELHGWRKTKMELSSRKFSLVDDKWEQELVKVFDAIDELRKRGCILLTNENTGLHVHVGFGDQNTPLDTCKTMFKVMTCVERQLDRFTQPLGLNLEPASVLVIITMHP